MINIFASSIVWHLNVTIIKGHDQEKWNCEHTTSAELPSVSRPAQWITDRRPDLGSSISIHPVSTFSAGLSDGVRVLPSGPPPILSFCPWIEHRASHYHLLYPQFCPLPLFRQGPTMFPNSKSSSRSFPHSGIMRGCPNAKFIVRFLTLSLTCSGMTICSV